MEIIKRRIEKIEYEVNGSIYDTQEEALKKAESLSISISMYEILDKVSVWGEELPMHIVIDTLSAFLQKNADKKIRELLINIEEIEEGY